MAVWSMSWETNIPFPHVLVGMLNHSNPQYFSAKVKPDVWLPQLGPAPVLHHKICYLDHFPAINCVLRLS